MYTATTRSRNAETRKVLNSNVESERALLSPPMLQPVHGSWLHDCEPWGVFLAVCGVRLRVCAHWRRVCHVSHDAARARSEVVCLTCVCARALGHATRTPRPTDEVPTVRGLARGTLGDFAENVVHVLF